MMTPYRFRMTLFALFMVLLIDGIAQGIMFPILANTLIATGSHQLVVHMSSQQRNILYGLAIGIFYLCWFIGAPILSDLSDNIGRKKALLICLGGSSLGFIITALAFVFHSIILVIIGRVVDGFTTGSQPIAQAAIVDICDSDKKARYIAYIMVAVSLGIVLGPTLGGVFSDPNIISWFTSTTPLYLATIVTLFNMLLLVIYFAETREVSGKIQVKLTRAFNVFKSAVVHPVINKLVVIFIFLHSCWGIYLLYSSAYLAERFRLSGVQNAYFTIALGIGITFGLLLCGSLEKRFKTRQMIVAGYGLLAVCMVVTLVLPTSVVAWILAIPAGFGLAIGVIFMIKLFSDQIDADHQGWVMGVTNGIVALSQGSGAIVAGLFASLGANVPYFIALGLVVMGVWLMTRWHVKL